MTNEEAKAAVAALLRERQGYAARGMDDRVAEVDRILRRYGAEGQPPAKRSEKRKK